MVGVIVGVSFSVINIVKRNEAKVHSYLTHIFKFCTKSNHFAHFCEHLMPIRRYSPSFDARQYWTICVSSR